MTTFSKRNRQTQYPDSLDPHAYFKSILHSKLKLKSRLAGLGDENMTYQDSKKVKLHKTKNMGKNDKD